jgi:hypothetical protein
MRNARILQEYPFSGDWGVVDHGEQYPTRGNGKTAPSVSHPWEAPAQQSNNFLPYNAFKPQTRGQES